MCLIDRLFRVLRLSTELHAYSGGGKTFENSFQKFVFDYVYYNSLLFVIEKETD